MKIYSINYSNLKNINDLKNEAFIEYNNENKIMNWRQKLWSSYDSNTHSKISNWLFSEKIFNIAFQKYIRSENCSFLPFDFINQEKNIIFDLKTMNINWDIQRIINSQTFYLQANSVKKLKKYADNNNYDYDKCYYIIAMLDENIQVLHIIYSNNFNLNNILKLEAESKMPPWSQKTWNLQPIMNYILKYDDWEKREFNEMNLK